MAMLKKFSRNYFYGQTTWEDHLLYQLILIRKKYGRLAYTLSAPWAENQIKERWERKPHPASLICDGRSAQITTHLAGKISCMDLLFTVIKLQIVQPFGYSDIVLVKDGGPLHRSPMQSLACQAMANFCIYWVCTYFKLNRIAVTTCHVFDKKAGILC